MDHDPLLPLVREKDLDGGEKEVVEIVRKMDQDLEESGGGQRADLLQVKLAGEMIAGEVELDAGETIEDGGADGLPEIVGLVAKN